MSPLRVLYVSPRADPGDAERVLVDLAALHDPARVTPSICFLSDGPLVRHCREVLAISSEVVPAPPFGRGNTSREARKRLAELADSRGVELVSSLGAAGHLYGGPAARRMRRPALWTQHGLPSWRSATDVRAALIRAQTVVATSRLSAERQRRVNPRRVRVEVVHPGTRIPPDPLEARRARARAALGIAPEEFAVSVSGRLEPASGIHVVLHAAASLLHARSHARLFVIGEAPAFGPPSEIRYAQGLPLLAEQLGIRGRVTFTGFRDDLAECLAAMDVVTDASLDPRPLRLGLIEAMAAGVALVTSDSAAAREIVTEGLDGLLVPPGEHEVLAVALLSLHDDPERRAALASAGAQTARDRFDVRLMVRRMEDIYDEATSQ